MSHKMENFERAFSDHTSGCRRQCNCGKTYFDAHNGCYDWEEGELEALESGAGIPLEHSVGDISFEGRTYVDGCDCWHPRAKQIMAFIDQHAREIAEYLTLEKARKQWEADHAAVVK